MFLFSFFEGEQAYVQGVRFLLLRGPNLKGW